MSARSAIQIRVIRLIFICLVVFVIEIGGQGIVVVDAYQIVSQIHDQRRYSLVKIFSGSVEIKMKSLFVAAARVAYVKDMISAQFILGHIESIYVLLGVGKSYGIQNFALVYSLIQFEIATMDDIVSHIKKFILIGGVLF